MAKVREMCMYLYMEGMKCRVLYSTVLGRNALFL